MEVIEKSRRDLRRADLHTHTHCSDGKLSPAALVAKARAFGLSALAVTDHDCIDGLAEAMAEGVACGLEVLTGVELSVTVEAVEIHLLGYGFDPHHPGLCAYLAQFRQRRMERGAAMVDRLQALGVPLPFEAVTAQSGEGVLGRPHVARALVAHGLVSTYEDAFVRYLQDGGPAFVPKPLFPAREALDLLHEAGGLGVLAHPGHWTSDRVVMQLIREGLDGIETIHPAHDDMLTRYYQRLAREFLLLETGGSDYHGFQAVEEERLGAFSIPYPQYEKVRQRTGVGTMSPKSVSSSV